MTIFSLLESFFFLFLGISFILVLLMVYHFKKKLETIEKKNETLQDICKTICEELDFVKSQSHQPDVKPQNIDPFYLNYHKVNDNYHHNANQASISDIFKTILVSSGGGNVSIPEELDIQRYENEELDDIRSYEEDYQESDNTTSSTVEEIEDFEGKLGEFDEEVVHVVKLDEQFLSPNECGYLTNDIIVNDLEEEEREEEEEGVNNHEVQKEKKEEKDKTDKEKKIVDEDIHAGIPKDDEEWPLEEKYDETDDVESKSTSTKASLQKLTLQMLRTMVIKEGLCTDPSKLKKLDLIQIVLDSQ